MSDRTKGSGRGSTRAARPSRAERRAQLLDAAVEAIRTVGAHASMEQLAAGGGVTKPILYRHFGDRDGLVGAIGEQYATLLLTRIGDTLHEPTPEEMLWSTIDGYLEFLEQDPELYTFLMRQTSQGEGAGDVNALIDVIGRQVAIVVGDQLRAQGLDAGGAEPFAFGIVGMVHQAGDWWLRTRTMSRRALTTYLAELLWKGFEGMGASTTGDENPPLD